MRSPLAKGLFARAIAQGGPGLLGGNVLGGNATLSERESAGAAYADSKGAHSLAELRALAAAAFFMPTGGRGGPFETLDRLDRPYGRRSTRSSNVPPTYCIRIGDVPQSYGDRI